MTTGTLAAVLLGGFVHAMIALLLIPSRAKWVRSLVAFLGIGSFCSMLLVFFLEAVMLPDREAYFREVFHVPANVALGRIQGGEKTPVCVQRAIQYRTSTALKPDQLARYVAAMNDPNVWRPRTPPHYDPALSLLRFAPDALKWHELPAPRFMGKQQLVWRIAGQDVRQGWALCYKIQPLDERLAPGGAEKRVYAVTPCNAQARNSAPEGGGLIQAAIDLDKLRLNAAMHFDGRPYACKDRAVRWVNELLGWEMKPAARTGS